LARLITKTQDVLGSLDILVNNAGIQFVAPIEEFPDDKWEEIIGLNLSSVFYAMKAAVPAMRAKGWGRIINVASAHGLVASPNKIAYVAAKHGVVGATKVAALELANAGVTVNAICPGWVLTPLVERQLRDRAEQSGTTLSIEKDELLAEKQPMAKFTSPEAIGAMAVFLCSEAAETISGAALSIDGGWTAQ
jgi:3-hydroxybutyrate dehydrogenase